jgi:hypothetical protein
MAKAQSLDRKCSRGPESGILGHLKGRLTENPAASPASISVRPTSAQRPALARGSARVQARPPRRPHSTGRFDIFRSGIYAQQSYLNLGWVISQMDKILTRRQAVEFLTLDEKLFDNYFKNASEFSYVERKGDRGRFYFSQLVLEEWKTSFLWRTVELTPDDYALCLDFALAQHFRGYVLSDWGTARQREFGQKITNWVKGQLAEVAVKKFFKKEFGTEVELDFEIYDKIVPQDIISIVENGIPRPPKTGVGIKSSKPKSAYLVLGENEIKLEDRRSDFYIFCRPDIPDDHLLRLTKDRIIEVVKGQQHFPGYKERMPDFANMCCEIAGWCAVGELEEVTKIEGQEFDGVRFVKKSGYLRRDKASWQELISKL